MILLIDEDLWENERHELEIWEKKISISTTTSPTGAEGGLSVWFGGKIGVKC